MADQQACCICSALLDTYDPTTEKSIIPDRHLSCCGRIICLRCINQNERYRSYCPYCQTSSVPSVLPQGLKDPPAYQSGSDLKHDPAHDSGHDTTPPPPPYTSTAYAAQNDVYDEKHALRPVPEPALHFLHPHDTIPSLALAYGMPVSALRRANNLFADNLLRGRKTLLIPGEYLAGTGGVSLSPRPVEGEEEALRRGRVRRWMMGTKCADNDIANLYLTQAEYDVDAAILAFREDEQWEKDHPLESSAGQGRAGLRVRAGKSSKSPGMRRFVGRT